MGNRTRQKNKRGDSKVESNDSPEIPDRGETSDIPGLPLGVLKKNIEEFSQKKKKKFRRMDKQAEKDTTEIQIGRQHQGRIIRQ